MPLSWNEIKDRALRFSREWADEADEHAEAKSFWDGFFNIFGVSRRRVANFERLEGDEEPVEFALVELHKHVRLFGFIVGYQPRALKEQDPVTCRRPNAWATCTTRSAVE